MISYRIEDLFFPHVSMQKDFNWWNIEKQKLDIANRIVHPKPREIWYIKIGINIWKEIYGKIWFFRPVLVVSKLASLYFCIPLTTKDGNQLHKLHIVYPGNIKSSYLVLNQWRVYDSQRFFTRWWIIDKSDFSEIKNHLRYMYFPSDS